MVRYAIRGLLRAPGFTLTALATLALGIGANTAVFSAIHALLLKPLPYHEPERLVALCETGADRGPQPVALENLLDWRRECRSFAAMAAYLPRSFGLTGGRGDEGTPVAVVQVGMVTSDFFHVLGARMRLGRSFGESEEREAVPVVVLGDALWRHQFAADPDVLGRVVRLNDEPHTVIAVLGPGFVFPMGAVVPQAYIPLSQKDYGGKRDVRSLGAVARLARGVSPQKARAELEAVAGRIAAAYPATNRGWSATLDDLDEALRGSNRRPLALLAAAAALLLGIACINVANLLLARSRARGREVAVRVSLGAGALDLARQFFVEGLILSLAGAALGVLLAQALLALLPVVLPLVGGAMPAGAAQPRIETAPLLFTLALALATSLLFGLLPVIVVRRWDLNRLLKEGAQPGRRQRRLSGLLVVSEIALSVTLLVTAGLLLASFVNVVSNSPGFDTAGVLRFGIGLPEKRYDTERKLAEFHQRLLDRLRKLPGVESAGAVAPLPLTGRAFRTWFEVDGRDVPREARPTAAIGIATPGYLESMRIPRLAGRDLSWRDNLDAPRVVLVNRAFERAWFPGASALGHRLKIGWRSDGNPAGTSWEIVGVTGDTREVSLELAARPQIYLPMGQFPVEGCTYTIRAVHLDPSLAVAIPAAVKAIDPELERIRVGTMEGVVGASAGDRRLALWLTGVFALVALGLAGVGVYGVVSFSVRRRRHEMAVRAALGARRADIVRLVLGQGIRLAVAGAVLGLVAYLWLGRLVESRLYEVRPDDPLTVAAVALTVCVVALAASAMPSLEAARADPAKILRGE